jgi:hypothetical protein
MSKIIEGKLIYKKISNGRVIQANYNASMQDKHIVDDIIALWTWPWNIGTPPYSHTEIMFCLDKEWWCFSATSRPELGKGKLDGTRWANASHVLRNSKRWGLQIKKYSLKEIEEMVTRANSLIGKRYDHSGVKWDFLRPGLLIPVDEERDDIYCSKAVRYVLTGRHKRVSPRRQYKWFKDQGARDCFIH